MRRQIPGLLKNTTSCFNTASGMRSHATPPQATVTPVPSGFNTASGMRSHATKEGHPSGFNLLTSFNTASGMRSHATPPGPLGRGSFSPFQYRKRYEVTCDFSKQNSQTWVPSFQYRKRYEVTCDCRPGLVTGRKLKGFNTASGMRSHATRLRINI